MGDVGVFGSFWFLLQPFYGCCTEHGHYSLTVIFHLPLPIHRVGIRSIDGSTSDTILIQKKSQLLHFTILVANKQHFSLSFLFLCSCWLVVSRIFHVLTELLLISLTEMFTQIISPFFVCMVYCMCVGGTHTWIWTYVCPFVCTCGGRSRTLGVFLNYFLPHCLERRSLTELGVCCPSCVGCLVVLGL